MAVEVPNRQSTGGNGTAAAPFLVMEGISRAFPGVRALDSVDFAAYSGEVHGLVGENGAGKSTLMNILAGLFPLTSGKIALGGEPFHPRTPREAEDLGIAFVHQELSLFTKLDVAENLFLPELPKHRYNRLVDHGRMRSEARQLLESFGMTIDPRTKVAKLSMAERQVVEIVRTLARDSKVVIFDEPTASLSDRDTASLFEKIKILKQRGKTIIYISHRLDEVFQVCDRVTVLRDGRKMGELAVSKTSKSALIRLMVGRDLSQMYPERLLSTQQTALLRVENLSAGSSLRDVSLTLHAGEILGLAGLRGSGRTELLNTIFGLQRIDSGGVHVGDQLIRRPAPRVSLQHGIAYVTGNRQEEGLVLAARLRDNLTMTILNQLGRGMFRRIDRRKEREWSAELVKRLDIKAASLEQQLRNLSGGNQQKVVVGKWLAREPQIYLFDEPTRGIDVGAKTEIYHIMDKLVREGKGIMISSSDLPELCGMCDRVAVMNDGGLRGILSHEEATQQRILEMTVRDVQ